MRISEGGLTAEDVKKAKYGDLNQGDKLVKSKLEGSPKGKK